MRVAPPSAASLSAAARAARAVRAVRAVHAAAASLAVAGGLLLPLPGATLAGPAAAGAATAASAATAAGAADDAGFTPVYLPRMQAARAAGPIAIDGVLGDPGWAGAARADNFAEHQPGDQVKPPVDTEAYLTYDDDHLYVAFVCRDDPREVRATLCERDHVFDDDLVFFCLDPYGTGAWAYEIAANPYGIQGDLLFTAGQGEDSSFDLVYESAGRIDEAGWIVEMAIPFTSLRFPDRPEQTWRVDFWRNYERAVRHQMSWAAYSRDNPCWPCQWGTVSGISGVSPGQGVELLPAFVSQQTGRREDSGRFEDGAVLGEPSLGVKYALSSSITAEAAFNPDFSQVEADAAQIDVNTPYALSYAEKRPFFLEGSDLFNTLFRTVYTRSINDPIFALKVTGRPGRTQLAALVARDEQTPVIIPFAERSTLAEAGRSTSTIVRLRREMGERSHLGVIGTDRRYDGGGGSTLFGLDGRWGFAKQYEIYGQVLGSYTDEPNDTTMTPRVSGLRFERGRHTAAFDGEEFWGHAACFGVDRDGRHFDFDLFSLLRSPTYRADNGFQERNDQRQLQVQVSWAFYERGPFTNIRPSLNAARLWDHTGTRKDEWANADLSGVLHWAQWNWRVNYLRSDEIFHGIRFRDIWAWRYSNQLKPAGWLGFGGDINYGHRIARGPLVMGKQWNGGFYLDLKPRSNVTLESRIDWIRSDALRDGARLFDGYIARSKLAVQFSRALSTRLVVQYDDFDRIWEADPLVTYRLSPFSIFYVGSTRDYAEFAPDGSPFDEDDTLAGLDPAWRLAQRQYFLKLQYLFQM